MKRNFQAVIDAAFGGSGATNREMQVPSDEVRERGRTFLQRASKIEALRQRRLASPAVRLEKSSIEVVRHRGHWRTLIGGKHSTPFADQPAAILAAKTLARKKRDLGQSVEVILRRTDGESVVQSIDDDECVSRRE